MKKVFISLIVFAFTTSIFAIDFSIGLKGNIGIANTFMEVIGEKEETEPLLSGGVGAVLGVQICDWFSVEPEFMIHIGNGFSHAQVNKTTGYGELYTVNWTTFEIPLMAKFKLSVGKNKLVFAIGPQFNLLLGDINRSVESKGFTEDYVYTTDDLDIYPYSLGAAAGIEYDIPVGPGTFVLGMRYQMDITNLCKNTKVSSKVENSQWRNMAIFPFIAYTFRIKSNSNGIVSGSILR